MTKLSRANSSKNYSTIPRAIKILIVISLSNSIITLSASKSEEQLLDEEYGVKYPNQCEGKY